MGLAATVINLFLPPVSRVPYSTGQSGLSNLFPSGMEPSYEQAARAFLSNEIVNTAITLLATSAAEPAIEGRRWRRERPNYPQARKMANVRHAGPVQALRRDFLIRNGFYEELPNHPLVKLLERPNPYMDTRAEMMQLLVMDRYIAGNAYLLKARSEFGNVAELWRLRPDRVRIVANATGHPIGYQYTINDTKTFIPYEDVIHWKELHPLSEHYGASRMTSIMPRIATDAAMREMLGEFYEGGGVGPGAILTVSGTLSETFREEVRAKLRRMLNSPGAFRETLILEKGTSDYQRLGLERGLTDAVPKDVNAVMESRIAMPFGIPASILSLLVGMESSSYANKRADWQVLWDITMTPLMTSFDAGFTAGLCHEFGGIDEVQFDLGDIRALQEDIDDLHDRARKNTDAKLWTVEEGRLATGVPALPAEGDHFILRGGDVFTDTMDPPEPPEPVVPPPAPDDIGAQIVLGIQAARQIASPKVGRSRRENDAAARALWDEAVPMLASGKSFEVTAGLLGVHERTLRRYRDAFDSVRNSVR